MIDFGTDETIRKVDRVLKIVGTFFMFAGWAVLLYLAWSVRSHPELYALKGDVVSGGFNMTPVYNKTAYDNALSQLNLSGVNKSGLPAYYNPDEFAFDKKVDNCKTYQNTFELLFGWLGYYVLAVFSFMAVCLRWAQYKLRRLLKAKV